MRLNGLPTGTMTTKEVLACLDMSKQNFIQSGLSEFLDYYEVGRSRLYLKESVADYRYWRLIQEGLAALGYVSPSPPAPLLPPGETMKAKRIFLDAWIEEDSYGVECPRCGENAVRGGTEKNGLWCMLCGIIRSGV